MLIHVDVYVYVFERNIWRAGVVVTPVLAVWFGAAQGRRRLNVYLSLTAAWAGHTTRPFKKETEN